MEINSNNLINKDILQTNKFDNLKTENIEDEKALRKVSDDFESFFYEPNYGYIFTFNKCCRRRSRF